MKRINLTEPMTGQTTSTWFDADRATRYDEDTTWNGSNHISHATGSQTEHEALYHTASGRWVLNRWSQWEGTRETYTETPEGDALAWLIANDYAEVVAQVNAGELAARELGAGSTPQRTIRIADDLWQAAQDRARTEGTDTSGLIRRLLADYLA